MRATIEALTKENSLHAQHLTAAKLEVSRMKEKESVQHTLPATIINHSDPADSFSQSCAKSHDNRVNGKVLVLTDDCGRRLYDHLHKVLSNTFRLQVICKPFARFRDIIACTEVYISDFSSLDFVIVLAGMNNENVRLDDLTLLANKCFHTNLIMTTIPVNEYGSTSLRRINNIKTVNNKIVDCVRNLKFFTTNIDCVDTNNKFLLGDFLGKGLYLNSRGMLKLSRLLLGCLTNFSRRKPTTNLRYIVTVSSLPSNLTLNTSPAEVGLGTGAVGNIFLEITQSQ